MKKIFILGLLTLLLLAGCSRADNAAVDTAGTVFVGFVPSFTVTGDVEDTFVMNRERAMEFDWTEIQNGDLSLPAVLLADVVATASPRAENHNLLLIGVDGLAARISGADLEGCFIAYSGRYAWECVNFNHPISSRIKMLHEIVVISDESADDRLAVGLVDENGSRMVTAGRLRMSPYHSVLSFEGRSEMGGRDVIVYTPQKRVIIPEMLDVQGQIAIVGRDGSVIYDRSPEYLEISGNALKYKDMYDVAGVMTNAPLLNITEAYRDALFMLERDDKVLVVVLDGLGWEMFQRSESPYLNSQNALQALAAFPPISPTGLASILTGELPDVHGICDRSTREHGLDDIFVKAGEMGKKSSYVEGNTSLIKTSLVPVLSLGTSGDTDDEVFENAVKVMEEGPDLLVVHFHGIDDISHTYGPYARETRDKIMYIDGLVSELANLWRGKIIITADHGQHEIQGGGDHGKFCAEDMLVPYIIATGGGH